MTGARYRRSVLAKNKNGGEKREEWRYIPSPHDLYIYTFVLGNMRAHNVDVRSFILRSACTGALVAGWDGRSRRLLRGK